MQMRTTRWILYSIQSLVVKQVTGWMLPVNFVKRGSDNECFAIIPTTERLKKNWSPADGDGSRHLKSPTAKFYITSYGTFQYWSVFLMIDIFLKYFRFSPIFNNIYSFILHRVLIFSFLVYSSYFCLSGEVCFILYLFLKFTVILQSVKCTKRNVLTLIDGMRWSSP